MESKASYSPVKLRIASLRTCEHNIEHKERQKYSEHSYKFQDGSNGNVAVFIFSCGLNKLGKHNAKAKKITDVGKMHVEIPTDHIDVIKNSETRNASDKAERAIKGLENKLCCSVFTHKASPLIFS